MIPALLALLAAPALAAECYISDDGSTLERTATGVTVTRANGSSFFCSTKAGGTDTAVGEFLCEKLHRDLDITGSIFFIASTKGGEKDLLVFYNQVWYPQCK